MKTKLQILSIALVGLIVTSCSSSMYMSKTSITPTDDIYYTPGKITTTLVADETSQISNSNDVNLQNASASKFAQLEKKYSNIESPDTISSDTLATKVENENPYERVLSDSYQESYERRLRGMEDPRYGMENWSTYYSNDYWYANAYDPAFYNTIVMGGHVWVEPWYISTMFLWPHNHHFWFGFGWNYSWGWDPWYYNNYYYPYYGYNSWYGWDPYWNSYSNGYWDGHHNHNYYDNYARRTDNTSTVTTPNRRTDGNKTVTTHRRGENTQTITARNGNNHGTVRTRNTTSQTTLRGEGNTKQSGNQVVTRRPNRTNDINTTRIRTEKPTRSGSTTEPTRRSYDSNYQRPRSTNSNDYIRPNTRNKNTSGESGNKGTTTRTSTPSRERKTSPTYNTPGKVSSPSTKERSTSSGRSERESSSVKQSNSSSSSSSSSGNSSSSNRSSGNSGSTRRR